MVGKAEHLAKGDNPRFVVTSLSAEEYDARVLYEATYCARGEMENRIKEQQLMLFADRTSAGDMRANQIRLYFSSIAYVLMGAMRRIGLAETPFERAQCNTIRLKLLKIGALVRITVRKSWISFSSSYPYRDQFMAVLCNIRRAPVALASQQQRIQLVWQRKYVVEIRRRQQFRLAILQPGRLGKRLALGAMAVTAAVVQVPLVAAALAPLAVASRGGRATWHDRPRHLTLGLRRAVRAKVLVRIAGEDVRELNSGLLSRRRAIRRGDRHDALLQLVLGLRQTQQVERTLRLFQVFFGNVQVLDRRIQAGVTHQDLNGAQVDSRFEQVCCETVPQRVNAAAVGDVGSLFEPIKGPRLDSLE